MGNPDHDRRRAAARPAGGTGAGRARRGPSERREGPTMPKVEVGGLTINSDVRGAGEPLLLIPYLSADNACFAFQLADYAKHFTCVCVDPRGAGESDKPAGP